MTIFAQSLPINQTVQFMTHLIHRDNSSLHSFGYLLVEVIHIQSPIVTIRSIDFLHNEYTFYCLFSSCVISTMCPYHKPFHYINPTSQLFLFSHCLGPCSQVETIQWKIYQGSNSAWNRTVQWTLFSPRTFARFYGNDAFNAKIINEKKFYFSGWDTKNLTIQEDFLTENRTIVYWRFQVIYSFKSQISEKEFDIELNGIPRNGRCSIDPPNGTMLTRFIVNCFEWYDEDGIKDFTVYGW